tara:strand:+ start:441 stop:794 length:354 start_codon:yes stop_codon:yes gene_type:complete
MAHFAKLGLNSQVLEVVVVSNDTAVTEKAGVDHLVNVTKHPFWVQTSYNKNFRKNYAAKGDTYDHIRDAFIPVKPYPSWTLNETTCRWEPPTPEPEAVDGKHSVWNEETKQWDLDNS